jgi:hypothetical protein
MKSLGLFHSSSTLTNVSPLDKNNSSLKENTHENFDLLIRQLHVILNKNIFLQDEMV